jgi:hypothetical protein
MDLLGHLVNRGHPHPMFPSPLQIARKGVESAQTHCRKPWHLTGSIFHIPSIHVQDGVGLLEISFAWYSDLIANSCFGI